MSDPNEVVSMKPLKKSGSKAKEANPPMARSWGEFDRRLRYSSLPLLATLDSFDNAILVAGCQRSGTTMLTEVINTSSSVENSWTQADTELEMANVLAGRTSADRDGRYCFQTTYVNDRIAEYFEHDSYRLIWVIRNPQSVVYSMVANWRRSALIRLFRSCGHAALPDDLRSRYARYGHWGFSRLDMACYSYVAKVSQSAELMKKLGSGRMLVVDYDRLVEERDVAMPRIFRFLELAYETQCSELVHTMSRSKAVRLGNYRAGQVDKICSDAYKAAKKLILIPSLDDKG